MLDNVEFQEKLKKNQNETGLKGIISNLSLPEGMGVIIRTAGQNKDERFFNRDLNFLLQQWDEIEAKIRNPKNSRHSFIRNLT